jgi:Fe-S cluster assembly iron-binding protein IscA
MLQVTENAASTLEAAKRHQQIPEQYGVRVSGAPTAAGQLEVRIGWAEAPLEGDAVDEQHGMRVFIAEEGAEPLADAALDVTVTVSGNGDTPPELVLRSQDEAP